MTMPQCFIDSFGCKTTVIIDCFEIFIDKPSNLMARAQTFSNYKHHNTVKVLIGISPQGTIPFVSEASGGRTSDKFLTENCGFLRNLLPGDLVLADRGFTIHDEVMFYHANLNIPAFTEGKSQLDPVEIEKKGILLTSGFMLNGLLDSYGKSIRFCRVHFQLIFLCVILVKMETKMFHSLTE